MLSWVTAEQRPPLPVVGPHLQDGLFERPRGQSVKDGVKGAVDGQNKYDHPGADGTCRERKDTERKKSNNRVCLKIIKFNTLGRVLELIKHSGIINKNPFYPNWGPN